MVNKHAGVLWYGTNVTYLMSLSYLRKHNGETLIFDETISDWGSGESVFRDIHIPMH